MKRYSNKLIMTALAGSALLFSGCQEGDNPIDEINENETRGAILRTVEVISNEIAINADGSIADGASFSVIVEEQDQPNDGGDFDFMEVYVGFNDNTGGENSRDEVLDETIPATDFTIGEFGFPRFEYDITGDELLTALGLSGDQIEGGDSFSIRFELVLSDGRRYSFADNTNTLTGSFFSSPFLYTANVVCAPSAPTAGDWTFDLADSFGDGWNGASLTVDIDGEATDVTLDDGSAVTVTVNVPDGSEVISIVFNSGSFDEEVSFTVTSANGNVVIDQGPNPPVDTELLDYCPDNL